MNGNAALRPVPAWIPAFWLFALVLTLVVVPAAQAHASDINPDPRKHLNAVHFASAGYGEQDEQFCVESHDTGKLSNGSARAFLNETLVNLEDYKIWDGTGDWRIDLRAAQYNCTAYDSATRNTIEIEVHYAWDWSAKCGGSTGYYNCVVHDKPVWNPTYGHNDSRWAYVYLVFSSGGELSSKGRAFINHEFGHVFGLQDAGDCSPPSLMHSALVGYGCTNWMNPYPSIADFGSVVAVMNGA
jgi:hypothetical protein